METYRRFFRDIKKYREYLVTSISNELTTKYAKTVVGYLWWLLDPFLYMFIYVFIVNIALGRGAPGLPVFLFTGLLFWRWTSGSLAQCTNSIYGKRAILSNVYLPKTLFPLIKISINTVYFMFSIIVLLLVLLFYQVGFTWHFFEFFPILIVNMLLIFALGLWLAHLGVFYYDTDRILTFVLRFWYYVSPGLYDVTAVPLPYRYLLWLNPMTTIFVSSRNIFLYNQHPVYLGLLAWTIFSLIVIYFGLKKVHQFDRTYTKAL